MVLCENCIVYSEGYIHHENGEVVWNNETTTETAYYAIQNGHLECLQFFYSQGTIQWNEEDIDPLELAAEHGHLNCLRFLHEHGRPLFESAVKLAAASGHLDCLQYAHEQGMFLVPSAANFAAYNGHLDCLQYLHEHGCEWDKQTPALVAKNGKLDCLQYLHKHGCPWDEETPINAARYGQFVCLQYALQEKCPYDLKKTLAALNTFGKLKQFLNKSLDSKWWRNFLFFGTIEENKEQSKLSLLYQTKYMSYLLSDLIELKEMINKKQQELRELKYTTECILEQFMSKQIIEFVIGPYF